jgi:hypothetical protein
LSTDNTVIVEGVIRVKTTSPCLLQVIIILMLSENVLFPCL